MVGPSFALIPVFVTLLYVIQGLQMTRPDTTPGKGDTPRVSDEVLRTADAKQINALDSRLLVLDLRDARQALAAKDARIAELERERDYVVSRRQHWEAEACRENARADRLEA